MTSRTSWLRLLRFPIRFITFQKNAYVWSRFKKLRFHVSPVSLALFWYFLLGLESGTGKKLQIHTTGLSRGFLTQLYIPCIKIFHIYILHTYTWLLMFSRLGCHFGARKKRKVATKLIPYERYGQILFQKVASGYLLHFVQDGS